MAAATLPGASVSSWLVPLCFLSLTSFRWRVLNCCPLPVEGILIVLHFPVQRPHRAPTTPPRHTNTAADCCNNDAECVLARSMPNALTLTTLFFSPHPSPAPNLSPTADGRTNDAEHVLGRKWADRDPAAAAAGEDLYLDVLRRCHQVRQQVSRVFVLLRSCCVVLGLPWSRAVAELLCVCAAVEVWSFCSGACCCGAAPLPPGAFQRACTCVLAPLYTLLCWSTQL